jgi:hypothetical protein
MSAFKQFIPQDIIVSPFRASKTFSISGSNIIGSGIEFYSGINPTSSTYNYPLDTGITYKENSVSIYNSIKQLYYTNYLVSSSGDNVSLPVLIPGVTPESDRYVGNTTSPRFDNYLQSDIIQSRYFPIATGSEISVISIPSTKYGENIVPQTFELIFNDAYVDDYVDDYFAVPYSIVDDGEGNVLTNSTIIGQIFYSHGIIVLTHPSYSNFAQVVNTPFYPTYGTASYGTSSYGPSYDVIKNIEINFDSHYIMYENQYKCTINENEFQYSLNPTLLSGSTQDTYYDFATGSYFNPYITTVGLYNDNKELIAVGKLAQPIPVSEYIDTTIIVSFDFA